jgi:hypothetical protein
MAVSADDSCERLEGTEQFFGDTEKTDLHFLDAGGSGSFGDTPVGVTGETQDSQWHLVSSDLFGLRQHDDVSYSPSIRTDFSGLLPELSTDDDLNVAEGYNPEAVVQSAWKSLAADTPKLTWERNFWEKFLDPNVSAMDMLEKGFKRPLPAPIWEDTNSAPQLKLTDEFSQNRSKRSKAFYNMLEIFLSAAGEKSVKPFGRLLSDDGWHLQKIGCRIVQPWLQLCTTVQLSKKKLRYLLTFFTTKLLRL